ncbi:MAG: hypothetical protein H0T56_14355 [Pseudaminobacter sp.]|nr:hypothetical protein [Pseudaminobacter sp.]
MTESSTRFDFGGAGLSVTANSSAWTDWLRRSFPTFIDDAPARADDFTLNVIETRNPGPGPKLPLTWAGHLPDGFMGRVSEMEGVAVLEVEGGGVTVIDHRKRAAAAHVRPASYAQFFGSAVMLVVDAAIAAGDQQLVHGASLVEKKSGRAVLICVPSGGGKTTTALALAHDGFSLMTDDASVLIPDATRPQVWGLPRMLKVHRNTARLMPWVGPLPDIWDANGEQGLSLDSLAGRIDVAAPGPAELGAVFLLGPRSPGPHRVSPLPKAEMLIAVSHDNVAWRAAGMVSKALLRFDVLARTIALAPTFRIEAGPDLASLPGLVVAAVNGEIAEEASA